MTDEGITVKRSIEIPTDRGQTLKLERDNDQVKVTYTGFHQPTVNLEHLRGAIAELGE